jgi:riboflavin synthase
VYARHVSEDLMLGDSVAIDGVCQTVVEQTGDAFEVQAVATTLSRTTLGSFAAGRRVNLERALTLGARLGGHMVQGHVDGVGRVTRIRHEEELVLIDFAMPPLVAEVAVLHGSITLNGVSLTINRLPAAGVGQVSIIPHTWNHTNFADLSEGDEINVEGDLIGKYVRHLLGAPAAAAPDLFRAWGYNRTDDETA